MGLLIVEPGAKDASLVALDPATGEQRWAAGGDKPGYAAPVAYQLDGEECVAIFNAWGLAGYGLQDGSEKFRHEWETDYEVNAATPSYYDGHFFVVSGYGKGGGLISVAGDGPELIYETTDVVAQFQSPVRVGAQIYLVSGDNNTKAHLSCLNFADGKLRWSEPLGRNRGGVIAAGEWLIAVNERGEVRLAEASADAYTEAGRFQATGGRVWAAPALADGRLLVRNNAGRVSCFDLR